MATIKEFQALRPPAALVDKVSELPYDVCSTEEARVIAKDNRYNFYHISKPEIDLPEGTDPYSTEVYRKGAENLQRFIAQNYLVKDEQPHLYLYTLVMNGRTQTGLVTCVSIDDYIHNRVKKHEYTREDKEQDRIRHLTELKSQTGLVFLLCKENPSLETLWAKALEIAPVYDFTAKDGVRHIARCIEDSELINAFIKAFQAETLYIADGHHRAASAVKYGVQQRELNPGFTGDEEFNYFLSVIFPQNQLHIMPYNRVIKDLNGLSKEEFFQKLEQKFTIEKTTAEVPSQARQFSLYIDKEWYLLTPTIAVDSDPVSSLDVSILQNEVLSPVLGIENPRTSDRINFIGGIRGTGELVTLVDSGKYQLAFSLYPTSINDLILVSDDDQVMPPKSTWFEPKLRSGIFLHQL